MEKPLAFQHWSKCGIQSTSDLLAPDGNINEEFIRNNLINRSASFFEIAKLKRSIPLEWKSEPHFHKPTVKDLVLNKY